MDSIRCVLGDSFFLTRSPFIQFVGICFTPALFFFVCATSVRPRVYYFDFYLSTVLYVAVFVLTSHSAHLYIHHILCVRIRVISNPSGFTYKTRPYMNEHHNELIKYVKQY